MAFDGITTNCIMQELKQMLVGQRISKNCTKTGT